ncbi:MAG: response regulator [Candidatus Peregrinibacteria bacterium]
MAEARACKILVAEDDKFLSRAYEFKLRTIGCQIILAHDGEEALDKIKSEKPDLVLLDIIMPKKTGFDVLKEIKSIPELRDTAVIIMSNLGQEADVKKGLDAGALDYIVKANTSLEDVVKLIEKTLKNILKEGVVLKMPVKTASAETPAPKGKEKTDQATCPSCKTLIPPGTKFCPNCGQKTGS